MVAIAVDDENNKLITTSTTSSNDDDDDDDDDVIVQLGFSEPIADPDLLCHNSASWEDWDGGQVGGKPSWLNPKHLPKNALTCKHCPALLRFICQLYAPADQVNIDAYHRTIYVFACPTCSVSEGSIRVLRCNLPKENHFFPVTCTDTTATQNWKQHHSFTHNLSLCEVCGQRGKGKCPLQKVSFCGREHQKEYKKYCFKKKEKFLPSVYKKSELVVDEEPPMKEGKEGEREALIEAEENDPDEDLEQEDIDEMMGKKEATTHDPTTTYFQERIQRAQDQCLRYYTNWNGEELWILSEPVPKEIPACPDCGGERKCEFQIMPQMLFHILEDHRKREEQKEILSVEDKHALSVASEIVEYAAPENVPPMLKERHDETVENIQKTLLSSNQEIDWGVISVYTCIQSCGKGEQQDDSDLGAYREEYAWMQPPL